MPPVVLEILVDADKGITELRQFDKALADTTKTTQQISQAQTQAAQGSSSFGASLGKTAVSALTFAGALTGVQLGISAVSTVFQSLVSDVASFEAAMANVNTLGIRSVAVQQQLRTELLQLPSVLGSATELAKGLYEVLSSGIEPAKAVQFLETSANLAKAGLGQLDTATAALTKTMQAFKIPTEEAARVSDILFKTVEIGQGSLEQFAGAFPQVTQIAASLGLSLTDTANAMATLTQTFRNADTAATGFRSLLAQLTQNSEKFLALGINIKQVISEQGLLGVVRTLQQVSQGSSERLRTFVNDIEGFQAAVALTGPQFQTLIKNQQAFQESTGSVANAVKIQTQTATEAWRSFTTSVSKLAQDLSPPLTSLFATIVGGVGKAVDEFRNQMNRVPEIAKGVKADLDKLAPEFAATVRNLLQVPVPKFEIATSVAELHAEVQRLAAAQKTAAPVGNYWLSQFAKADTELNKALVPLTTWRDETVRSTEAQKVAAQGLQVTTTAITQLDAALKLLKPGELPKVLSVGEAQQGLDAVLVALRQIATTSQVSAKEFQTAYSNAVKILEDRFGELTPRVKSALEDIAMAGKRTRESIETASDAVPYLTQVIKEVDEQGKITLKTIERFGPVTAKEMGVATAEVPPLTTAIKEVDEQGRITLRQVELFGPVTKEAMEQATQSTQTFAGAMKTAADIRFEKAIQALTEATLEYGNNLRDHLHPQLIRYLENLGLLAKRTQEAEKNTKGLSETAKMLGHYINELGKEVNAYGNEIARTTEQTQKLLDLQIRVKTPFADDLAGLQKQLQQANADLLALGNRIPQLGYEGYKQQQKVLLDLIAELEKRIAALKQTASSSGGGTTTGGTTTTTRPTGSTGGGSVTVTGPPAGSSGSGSGSVIVGGGNAPLSSIPVTTTQRSGATYNLTIQTQATDAATLARDLVPYLRQADLSSRRIGG